MKRTSLSIVILVLALTPTAFAEDDRDTDRSEISLTSLAPARTGSRPWDRLAVRLGGFAVRFDTNIRLDSDTLGVGTEFNLESDANVDKNKTEARLEGHVRFGRRHRIDYGTVFFRRSATKTLDRQIQFGDVVFNLNADVMTEFKNDVIKLAYRYDIVNRPAWDLGLSFGISAFVIDTSIAVIGGGGGMASAESEDFIAPIPVLGLHADVRLAKKWYLRTSGEFFDVQVDDQKGSLTDYRAAVDWYPFEHFGFGAGFNRSRLAYEDLGVPAVDVTYTYSGTTVYVSYVR